MRGGSRKGSEARLAQRRRRLATGLIAGHLRVKLQTRGWSSKRMRMREGLGDYPTVKLSVEEVARYAREADARVVEAESLARRSTLRPEAPGEPDIEVTVELTE